LYQRLIVKNTLVKKSLVRKVLDMCLLLKVLSCFLIFLSVFSQQALAYKSKYKWVHENKEITVEEKWIYTEDGTSQFVVVTKDRKRFTVAQTPYAFLKPNKKCKVKLSYSCIIGQPCKTPEYDGVYIKEVYVCY
jgi:hypothetical protein